MIRLFVLTAALACLLATAAGDAGLSRSDRRFLDELERASFRFFWEHASAETGLVKDRALAEGHDARTVSSTAATGFGLTALCIADQRGYIPRPQAVGRARDTLRFLSNRLPHQNGFFYRLVDLHTGERVLSSEVSSIETAILLCGALTCRRHFDDPEIERLAKQIYERVDWRLMLAGTATLSVGWSPESGFLAAQWDTYSELMMLYLLGIGSPSHPLSPETWHAWKRPIFSYDGFRYIESKAPLSAHQYSHAWFDFRGQRDRYADYYVNSILATKAHRLFCWRLRWRFPHFGAGLWGISPSDSSGGYVSWGGPPEHGPIDGTVVPAAVAGSLPFLRNEAVETLRLMRDAYGTRVWKRYGFVDAFNPQTGWAAPDVAAINAGVTLLMAENVRSEFVWNTFMKNDEVLRAMQLAGFTRIDD